MSQLLEITDGLLSLDPVRTYPERGAALVARLAESPSYRLVLQDGRRIESQPAPDEARLTALTLRHGRQTLGTLFLSVDENDAKQGAEQMRLARWGARVLARGMAYAERLTSDGGRRFGEEVEQALKRAPLTPRERDVVSLLVSGASTRDIADRTHLTVATVNTYLKRIFSKLGVHSRVELVARMAGTVGSSAVPLSSYRTSEVRAGSNGSPAVSAG